MEMTTLQEQTSDFFWAKNIVLNSQHSDGDLDEPTADDLSHALWMLAIIWQTAASSVLRNQIEAFFVHKMGVRCRSIEQFVFSLTSSNLGGGYKIDNNCRH